MYILCKLVIPVLALTLTGQVHAGRIFGGHEAKAHSRPYMVLLEMNRENNKIAYCDGFLLSEDFVMTAAHCHASSYTVNLGVHRYRDNRDNIQRIAVAQSFPHQRYNETDYRNDIMLLKLSSKANFTENVKPIAIAGKHDDSLPKSCLVSGWGRSDRNTEYMSTVLMEVNVTLLDNEKCVGENVYCSEGKAGPGLGDSGGPLVCEDGKAYGVVSFSIAPRPGHDELYAYAKIPDKRSWIESTIKNA